MKTVRETDEFASWIDSLRDKVAQIKIDARVRRLSAGNMGSFKNLGGKVTELKADYGPGYRVYYTEMDDEVIILLAGGDKRQVETRVRRSRTSRRPSSWRSS